IELVSSRHPHAQSQLEPIRISLGLFQIGAGCGDVALISIEDWNLDSDIKETLQPNRPAVGLQQLTIVAQASTGEDVGNFLHLGPAKGGLFTSDRGFRTANFGALAKKFC